MRRVVGLVSGFLLCAGVLVSAPRSSAQTLVITACKDSTGAGIGKNARKVLSKALWQQGIKLIGYQKYLQAAAKSGVGKRQARTKAGIQKIAKTLKLDGAITSTAVHRGGRFLMAFYLYDPDGKLLLKKAFAMKKPKLPYQTARKLADLVAGALGREPEERPAPAEEPELALIPLAPVAEEKPPTPPPVPVEESTPAPSPEDKQNWDSLLALSENPKEAGEEEQETEAARPAPAEKPTTRAEETPPPKPEKTPWDLLQAPVVKDAAPLPRKPRKPGSVPDVLLAGGMSINTRGGLSPRHQAGAFPGLRINGRLFLGTFTNHIGLRDIGLEGTFNQSLGLQAEPELVDETWDASQLQWRAGLVYRLSFESTGFSPAVLFRFDYGTTRYIIEYEHPEVLNTSYTYTVGALDIHLMPVRELLGIFLSAGYIFNVWPAEKLSGSGAGFTVAAGVNLKLFEGLHLGLGYEQVQFLFDERKLGQTSDQFQMFYLRAGWSLR
jgi:opacity protein-like surface antigen